MQNNINKTNKKVVVGLSGGVDSSVAALLLKNQGYEVIGLHMVDSISEEDNKAVYNLCEKLKIKCEFVTFSDEMQKVKDYFINEYKSGRTPNPCVVCNKEVKFKPFIDYAEKMGADFFATGHYAIIDHSKSDLKLLSAKDTSKDQTYFLNQLSKDQLSKAIFPLGFYTKDEIRKIAKDNDLANADKKDSYDVCFLENQKFKNYADKMMPSLPGNIIDEKTGNIVGKHTGLNKYTIGQRKGLGIGGGHSETGDAWFVTKKDIENNILYVSQANNENLFSSGLVSNNFNWISNLNKQTFDCYAKFRYRQDYQKVKVKINKNNVEVIFDEKQKSITAGQYVVLYIPFDNNGTYECLGGGTIDIILK